METLSVIAAVPIPVTVVNENTIETVTALLSTIAAMAGIFISYIVYTGQNLLSKRQQIVPLWEYISSLDEINPQRPIALDIIKSVNTLELIAIACEAKAIDKKVIKRVCATLFVKQVDAIKKCNNIPGYEGKSGDDLLKECPAILSFYNELMKDIINTNKVK